MRKIIPLALLPLAVAACAGPTPPRETTASTGPTPFTQALAQEYGAFARSEYLQLDWGDQEFFADKAQTASQGFAPAPENPAERAIGTGIQIHPELDYGKVQFNEAVEARGQLLSALRGGGSERNPQAAARAQVSYDCWVEQLEEGWQKDDIERCRGAFYTALDQTQAQPVAQLPAAAPQVSADIDRLQIFFPFDSADLNPSGREIVARAAEDIRQGDPSRVVVIGHADRAGPSDYNRQLSAERAEAVKDVLVSQGVPPNRIETAARGEIDPLVPTPDGVPQLENRRTQILFD